MGTADSSMNDVSSVVTLFEENADYTQNLQLSCDNALTQSVQSTDAVLVESQALSTSIILEVSTPVSLKQNEEPPSTSIFEELVTGNMQLEVAKQSVPFEPPKVFATSTSTQPLLGENYVSKGEGQTDDGMVIGIVVGCISVVVVVALVIGLIFLLRQLKDGKATHFVNDLNHKKRKKSKPKRSRSRMVMVTPASQFTHSQTVKRIQLD